MADLILIAVLIIVCVWVIRSMLKKKKGGSCGCGGCGGCPHAGSCNKAACDSKSEEK